MFCSIKGYAVLAAIVVSPLSQAVIAFDNFGPGTSFNNTVGLSIAGSTSASRQIRQAVKFTSSATGVLNAIQLAAGHVSGTNSLVVSLLTDNAGALGSEMTSWFIGYLPDFPGPYGTTYLFNSFPSIKLTAGSSYWVLVQPHENTSWGGAGNGSDTWAAWNLSPSGFGPRAFSKDGGVTFEYDNYTQGSLRVYVLGEPSVPGPAAALPFAVGMLAARRRRK